jgi:NAD(P)-dependent dehydrogenase (short-subunit alcohol dehydrogenase family)
VVYGVLACVACLGKVSLPPGFAVTRLAVEFRSPLFKNVDYRVSISEASSRFAAALMDGTAVVLRMTAQVEKDDVHECELLADGLAPRTEPRRLGPSDLTPGLTFSGRYSVRREPYLRLLATCGIERSGWGDTLLTTLLCTSYLVGMELPGEAATYMALNVDLHPGRLDVPTDFRITLRRFDERFAVARSEFVLGGSASNPVARGELTSALRLTVGPPTIASGSSERYAGKTVLIVGASRGLGAALSLAFAAEGASVIGVYARSATNAAEVMAKSEGLPGTVVMERGDAADAEWCQRFRKRILDQFGRVDVLVCNAAPALQSMRPEPEYYDRIARYIHDGFGLVAVPLTVFLDLVSRSHGSVLLVSSAAVDEPPRAWPHYVAMKAAAEGFVKTAAASYGDVRFRIARPARIATDFANTPMGRLDAEDPASVALRMVNELATPQDPGTVAIFR